MKNSLKSTPKICCNAFRSLTLIFFLPVSILVFLLIGTIAFTGNSFVYAQDLTDGTCLEITESDYNGESVKEIEKEDILVSVGEEGDSVRNNSLLSSGEEEKANKTESVYPDMVGTGTSVPLDETHFPDPSFRQCLSVYDLDGDGVFSEEEIAKVRNLEVGRDIVDSDIESLEGVQYFTSLVSLICSGNNISELDVSGLENLEELVCGWNQMKSLNVAGLKKLKVLNCMRNSLTSLDLTGLTSLEELQCMLNPITDLNLKELSSLKKLDCNNNRLTILDVEGLANLEEIQCYNNPLTKINLAGLKNLTILNCGGSEFTELDLTGLEKLEVLSCTTCALTKLDVTGLTNLKNLLCTNNEITKLSVAGLRNLERIECDENALTELELTGCDSLMHLNCKNNSLIELDVSQLKNLSYINCKDNNLKKLDLQGTEGLVTLDCSNNALTELDVMDSVHLEFLYCNDNYISNEEKISGDLSSLTKYVYEPQKIPTATPIPTVTPTPSHTHTFETIIEKATPDQNGSIVKECTTCGTIESTDVISYPKTITLSKEDYKYNGTVQKPSVEITDAEGKVISTSCYTVTYDNTQSETPGTYKIEISFKGDYYTGKIQKSYTISKADQTIALADATKRIDMRTITLKANITQGNKTGKFSYKSDNPSVASVTSWGKVTFNGVGTAHITATTKGTANYNSASKTITLTVVPAPTAITKLQSQRKGWLNIQYRANRAADGYQIQYGTSGDMNGAKYAAVNNSAIRSYTRKDVQSGETYYVRVRTFNVVNGKRYYSNWSGIKSMQVK